MSTRTHTPERPKTKQVGPPGAEMAGTRCFRPSTPSTYLFTLGPSELPEMAYCTWVPEMACIRKLIE